MATSGSYARGDKARSVPDSDADAYEAMARKQRALNEKQAADIEARHKQRMLGGRLFTEVEQKPWDGRVDHPGALESMIPVWGSGKEAIADFQDGDYLGAAGNAALAVSDLVPAKAVSGAILKGAVIKAAGPHVWRTKPWEEAKGVRQWLTEKGVAKPGQPVHHWVPWLEQKSAVPDWIKNQPIFLKPMKDAVQHGRVHGRYSVDGVKLPRYNPAERVWHGSPDWAKATPVSVAGRVVPDKDKKGRRP